MKKGKLVVFSAPSGSGKTTIVRHLLKNKDLKLDFSISATSREKREGEIEGEDYYFLSIKEFKKHIDSEDFLEWEEVYTNNFYGTLKSELERIWSLGKHPIFDIDVIGGLNIKSKFPLETLAIFVKVTSLKEIEKRLRQRQTETKEKIIERLAKVNKEIRFAKDFDFTLVNDNLEIAKKEALNLVSKFISK